MTLENAGNTSFFPLLRGKRLVFPFRETDPILGVRLVEPCRRSESSLYRRVQKLPQLVLACAARRFAAGSQTHGLQQPLVVIVYDDYCYVQEYVLLVYCGVCKSCTEQKLAKAPCRTHGGSATSTLTKASSNSKPNTRNVHTLPCTLKHNTIPQSSGSKSEKNLSKVV